MENDIKGKYNIIICNIAVEMYFQDLYNFFNVKINQEKPLSIGINNIGMYCDKNWDENDKIEIYTDPYMRIDDNKMILDDNSKNSSS